LSEHWGINGTVFGDFLSSGIATFPDTLSHGGFVFTLRIFFHLTVGKITGILIAGQFVENVLGCAKF